MFLWAVMNNEPKQFFCLSTESRRMSSPQNALEIPGLRPPNFTLQPFDLAMEGFQLSTGKTSTATFHDIPRTCISALWTALLERRTRSVESYSVVCFGVSLHGFSTICMHIHPYAVTLESAPVAVPNRPHKIMMLVLSTVSNLGSWSASTPSTPSNASFILNLIQRTLPPTALKLPPKIDDVDDTWTTACDRINIEYAWIYSIWINTSGQFNLFLRSLLNFLPKQK